MTVRSTMTALLARLRLLVDDPQSEAEFTDQQLQDACDAHRLIIRYEELTGIETRTTTGSEYLEHISRFEDWETVTLQDAGYAELTAATSDLNAGRWTFASEPNMPVYATGEAHDLHAAAADIWNYKAAAAAKQFAFSADGASYHLEQKYEHCKAQADFHRKHSRGGFETVRLERNDVNPVY